MVVEPWAAEPMPLELLELFELPELVEPPELVDVEDVEVDAFDVDESDESDEPDEVESEDVEVCELLAPVVFAAGEVTPAITVAVSAAPTAATTPLASFARRRRRSARMMPCAGEGVAGRELRSGWCSVMHPGCGRVGQGHVTEASRHS